MNDYVIIILIGLAAGVLSGSLGVGGGIIMIPAMVFLLGFSQQMAQGTSLVIMLPPVGVLAVLEYSRRGYVNWKYGMIMALVFVIGAYFGGKIATNVDEKILRKVFGFFIMIVAVKMIFSK